VQVRGLIARGGQAFLIICPWFVREIGPHSLTRAAQLAAQLGRERTSLTENGILDRTGDPSVRPVSGGTGPPGRVRLPDS